MAGDASGFCVYDDPAVAIAWLLAHGVERIAYVDVDVHHGDGVQAVFEADPRVLTVSIHEYAPEIGFFPGTGSPSERGRVRRGVGLAERARSPPAPTTTPGSLRSAPRCPPAVRAFAPDVLVTQLGCDTHHTDPLAHLRLTTRAYREAAAELHGLAHEVAGGRWVATGGGGYQWARVVPRAWTTYFAEMAEASTSPDELPAEWVQRAVLARPGRSPVPSPTIVSRQAARRR